MYAFKTILHYKATHKVVGEHIFNSSVVKFTLSLREYPVRVSVMFFYHRRARHTWAPRNGRILRQFPHNPSLALRR